jgi:hypothetical protein
VIARPTGIYGPGDRRLLKLFRGVAHGGSSFSATDASITTSPTSTISSKGFGLCGTVAAAAGRTYILAGGEVTMLNELVELIAQEGGVSRRSCTFRCGRSGRPERCAGALRALGSSADIPAPRGFLTKSAPSTSPAHGGNSGISLPSGCVRGCGGRSTGTRRGVDLNP